MTQATSNEQLFCYKVKLAEAWNTNYAYVVYALTDYQKVIDNCDVCKQRTIETAARGQTVILGFDGIPCLHCCKSHAEIIRKDFDNSGWPLDIC